MKFDYKKISILSILTTLAISVSLLEQFVPLDFILVGAKLGISNIIIIFAINRLGKKEAILILFAKILLCAIILGRLSSLLYSVFGGILSFLISSLLMKFYPTKISFIGICIGSCVGHHVGQIIASFILLSTFVTFLYLPYLLLISIPLGILTGQLLNILINRLEIVTFFN